MDIPIEINAKLLSDQGEDMDNPGRYQRLVGKLNYLMVTRPDIVFAIIVISRFLSAPNTSLECSITNTKILEKGSKKRIIVFKL